MVIGASYWGWFFVRQRPHGTATFGVMQLGAAVLAGLGFLGHRIGVAWLGVPGAIGLGAGACLLVIGPVARGLARRMVAAERMAIATRLLDLAELLAPGSGVAEEKALVRAMVEIREGRIEQTVDALAAARERAPGADARLAIDERIAMLYLTAYRWSDAIAHAEAHLFGALPVAADGEAGSLRHALGIAPPVWVELLGAYGRIGDLDQAARMLARLEDVCAGRDDAALWLHRGRMMFLALAGRIEAVRALVAPRQARHMSRAARTYWLAVAHEHGGDRAAAAQGYEKARARSRGRPRVLIEQALAGLADTRRAELPAVASEVVARVEAAPPPPRIRIAQAPRLRAPWVLAAHPARGLGDHRDRGRRHRRRRRAAARRRAGPRRGRGRRVVARDHLRVRPRRRGPPRAQRVRPGRARPDRRGAVRRRLAWSRSSACPASPARWPATSRRPARRRPARPARCSALLGAVFVEITWHRAHYRLAWKRGMWGALAVITVGELGYGFLTPVIDQWAHGAGLLAGVVVGLALSPTARWVRAGKALGKLLAVAFGVASVIAGGLVVRTPRVDSLTRGGFAAVRIDGLQFQAPASWRVSITPPQPEGQPLQLDGVVYQPDGLVVLKFSHQRGTDPEQQIATWLAAERGSGDDDQRAKDEELGELGELRPASEALIALPPGWKSGELVASPEDGMGYHQRIRVVLCGRAFGDDTVFVAIEVPETIAAAAPEFFAQLLASIGPA